MAPSKKDGCTTPAAGPILPPGWQPGKPTLVPGPDLAGKVWEQWKVENAFG